MKSCLGFKKKVESPLCDFCGGELVGHLFVFCIKMHLFGMN